MPKTTVTDGKHHLMPNELRAIIARQRTMLTENDIQMMELSAEDQNFAAECQRLAKLDHATDLDPDYDDPEERKFYENNKDFFYAGVSNIPGVTEIHPFGTEPSQFPTAVPMPEFNGGIDPPPIVFDGFHPGSEYEVLDLTPPPDSVMTTDRVQLQESGAPYDPVVDHQKTLYEQAHDKRPMRKAPSNPFRPVYFK